MNTSGPRGVTRRSMSEAIEMVSASNHETASSPSAIGATYRCTASTSPAFQAAACKATPPSRRSDISWRSPSRPNASNSAPLLIGSNSAPTCCRLPARTRFSWILSGVVTIITGPASSVENTRAEGGDPKPPIEQDSRQGTAAMDLARRQQGIVCENGPGSNRDSVDLGAHRVGVPKRIVRADSRALSHPRRHAVVDARRGLHDHERPMKGFEGEIRAVQPERALAAGTHRHIYAFFTQKIEPAATDARIGVDRRRHDPRDAGCRNTFDARACPACVTARLEGAIERRAPREISRFVERAHLSVRSSRPLVISLTHNRAVPGHNHRADHRIRTGRPPAPLGKIERAVHVLDVRKHAVLGSRCCGAGFWFGGSGFGFEPRTQNRHPEPSTKNREPLIHHLVSNNASTYSSTLNGMRSSIVSPMPT